MNNRLDEIAAKLRSGQDMTYDDAADLFELTMIGSAAMKFNGLSRADIMARLHAQFPDAATLSNYVRQKLVMLDEILQKGSH
jgi:hypothetical protein